MAMATIARIARERRRRKGRRMTTNRTPELDAAMDYVRAKFGRTDNPDQFLSFIATFMNHLQDIGGAVNIPVKDQVFAATIVACTLADRIKDREPVYEALTAAWSDRVQDAAEDDPKTVLLRRCLPYLRTTLVDLEARFDATDEGYQDVVELVRLIAGIHLLARLPDPKNDG